MHCATWLLFTTIFFFDFYQLGPFAESSLAVYRFFFWPARKIWKFFSAPLGLICKLIFILLKLMFFTVKSVVLFIEKTASGGTIGKCMNKTSQLPDETGLSPLYGRTLPLSSTEWELNCSKNRTRTSALLFSTVAKLRDSGNKASFFLDNDHTTAPKAFWKTVSDARLKKLEIDNASWCPKSYERGFWDKNNINN